LTKFVAVCFYWVQRTAKVRMTQAKVAIWKRCTTRDWRPGDCSIQRSQLPLPGAEFAGQEGVVFLTELDGEAGQVGDGEVRQR
jgi:hypothetical protein